MKKPAVIVATALSTIALAGAVGVGVASADPTPSPTTPTATASPTPGATPAKPSKADKQKKKAKRDIAARALHGEVTLGGKKKTRVVDFQRGTVSEVSSSSITVKSVDGFSATYVVDAKTVVRHAKEKAAIADVKNGDKVRVVASKDGSTLSAKRIADRTK